MSNRIYSTPPPRHVRLPSGLLLEIQGAPRKGSWWPLIIATVAIWSTVALALWWLFSE